MEHHLTRIDGRLNFCHDHLRNAVAERYLPSRVRRRNFHRRIAAWFSTQPVSPRRAEEEPWQWRNGEEWGKLEECLGNLEMFPLLNNERMKFQLLGYWCIKSISSKLEEVYLKNLRKSDCNVKLWCEVGAFLIMAGRYDGAARLFREALDIFNTLRTSEVGWLLDGLGGALTETGRFDEADSSLYQSLDLKIALFGEDSIEVAETLGRIGALLYQTKRSSESEIVLERALQIQTARLGFANAHTINTLGSVATACYGQRKFDKAEKLFLLQLNYLNKMHGDSSPETATCLNNLAALMSQIGQYNTAYEYFCKAHSLYENVYGHYHPNTAKALSNLSYTLLCLERVDEAETLLRQAIEIDRFMLGSDHPTIATKLINLGTLLRDRGNPTQAENAYREALEIRERCFGPCHVATAIAHLNIAGALKDQNRLDESLLLYERYLPKKIADLSSEDPSLQKSLSTYRDLLNILATQKESGN